MPSKVFLMTWALITAFLLVIGSPFSVAAIFGAVPAAVAGGATWFGLRSRRRDNDAKGSARPRGKKPLTVTEQPDGWTIIDARPPALPMWTTVAPMLVGFIAACIIGLNGRFRSFDASLLTVAAVWAGVSGLIYAWARSNNNERRHLQSGPFAVRADAVRLPDGNEISAMRIHTVVMRNGLDGEQSIVVTNSAIGALSSAGHARHQARLAAIAYRIDIDHAGISSTLAGGLTEGQARAVGYEVMQRVRGLV